MNPHELLRKAAKLAQQGFDPARIDAWVAQRSDYTYGSVKELAEALAATRRTQNAADRQANTNPAIAYAGGLANNIAQGLTLNNFDELMGAASALGAPLQGYAKTRDQYRAAAEDFAAQHPTAAALGQVGGGLAAGILSAGAIPTPAGYGAGLANAIETGGLMGLLSGAGRAKNLRDAPQMAADEGATGMVAGGVLGAVLPPAIGLARAGRSWMRQASGNPAALRAEADLQVGEALGAGRMPPEQALALTDRAAELQLPMVIPADAGGRSGRALRRALNNAPGLADPAEELAAARMGMRPGAYDEIIARNTGVSGDAAREIMGTAEAAKRAALDPIYKPLDALVVDQSTGVPQVLDDLAKSVPAVRKEIELFRQHGLGEPLQFKEVQNIEIHLRELAAKAPLDPRTRALRDVFLRAANRLDEAMQNGLPGYAGAKQRAAAAYAEFDAYQAGANSVGRNLTREELAAFNQMDDAAKQAWRVGKQVATSDALQASDPTTNAGIRRATTAATPIRDAGGLDPVREGWKAMFPSAEAVQNVDDAGRLLRQQIRTEQRALTGSNTTEQLHDLTRVAKTSASGPQSFKAGAIRDFLDRITAPQNEAVAEMVGRDLMAPYTPEVRADLLRKMALAGQLSARARGRTTGLIMALLGGQAAPQGLFAGQ